MSLVYEAKASQSPSKHTCIAPRLAVFASHEVKLLNQWYRLRRPLRFSTVIGDAELCFQLNGEESQGFDYQVDFSVQATQSSLFVTSALIRAVIDRLGLASDTQLSASSALLLLECCFSPALDALEAVGFTPLSIEQLVASKSQAGRIPLDGTLAIANDVFPFRLHASTRLASHVGSLLDGIEPAFYYDEACVIPVMFRVGVTRLGIQALQSLKLNDVILFDHAIDGDQVKAVFGERFCGYLSPVETGFLLRDKLTRITHQHEKEIWTMADQPAMTDHARISDAEFSEIQLRLVFELGRQDISLAQLRRMAPGYVFELARTQRTAVEIYAGASRVGHGEIVQINDTLGVRVTRLFNNE